MKTVLLSFVALLAVAPPVDAAEEAWFVGAGAIESDLGFDPLDDSATGWKVFGGYRFTRHFAAEIGYLDTGEAEESVEGATLTLGAEGTTTSIIATLPIGERFALHARAGFIDWQAELTATDSEGTFRSSASGQDFYWGAGATMDLGRFGLRLEYEVPEIEDVDVTAVSLSVLYRF